MTNRLVPFLAFVLFLSFLASLSVRLFRPEPPPAGPSRTVLAAASEMPGVTKTPEGDGPVLRIAVLFSALRGEATAIAAARDVPIDDDGTLSIPFSMTRALLPEFADRTLSGGLKVRVTYAPGGTDVVRLPGDGIVITDPGPLQIGASSRPRVIGFPERWVLGRGSPLVRIGDRGETAIALVVLERKQALATDGGTLSFWRNLFLEAGRQPFLDEHLAAAASAAVRPAGAPENWGAAAQAPLNGALGQWFLGDGKGLDRLRREAVGRDDFLDRAFATMNRDRTDEEWVCTGPLFALQLLGKLPFDERELQAVVGERVGRNVNFDSGSRLLHWSPPARTFRLLDDPVADGAGAWVANELPKSEGSHRIPFVDYETDLSGTFGRYAFEHDPPADREAVVAAWEKARETYLRRLSRTARLRVEYPGNLVAILVALALGSLLFAGIPRGPRPRLRIRNLPLLFLYASTLAGVNDVQLGHYLAPVWIALFLLWLRSDTRHPIWERGAIFVAVLSSLIRLVFQGEAEVIHPAMITVGDAWYGFAWLVIGRVVLSMPEHSDSKAFRAFLTIHVFTVVQGTAATLMNQTDRAGPAILTMLGVAVAAFLWFSLEEPVRRLRERLSRN
ncbi:MAG: hypothetical protein ABFS86_12885 [Planctomycetota bacterium]